MSYPPEDEDPSMKGDKKGDSRRVLVPEIYMSFVFFRDFPSFFFRLPGPWNPGFTVSGLTQGGFKYTIVKVGVTNVNSYFRNFSIPFTPVNLTRDSTAWG